MSDIPTPINLWDSLDRWYRVIHHFLHRGRAPRGMTDERYAQIYHELRDHYESLNSDQLSQLSRVHQSLYQKLRPWVHLESLSHCDKRILRMLEKEVRLIRDQLMPRERWRSHIFNRVSAVLILITLAATMIGLLWSGDPRAERLVSHFQLGVGFIDGLRARIWVACAQSSTNQRLIALAAGMVVVGTYFLRDRRRI